MATLNWRVNENPAADGCYILVRSLPWQESWSFYADTSYTVKGGWNTHYDSKGVFQGDSAIDVTEWAGYAWTTCEEFTSFMEGEIGKPLEVTTD